MIWVLLILALCLYLGLVIKMDRRHRWWCYHTEEIKGYQVEVKHEKKVHYLNWERVVHLDWDLPDPVHPSRCITIETREEAVQILEAWCQKHPGFVFRVYWTPGGVRAFCVSHLGTPEQLHRVMMKLRVDPVYCKFCLARGRWASRVSPKIGRAGDYVARYVCTVGTGEMNDEAVTMVEYHDEVINQNLNGGVR